MRTTLDIDEDVLQAAKELARLQGRTAGEVVSELARQGLRALAAPSSDQASPAPFFGFRPIAPSGQPVTQAMVEKLRDEPGV